MKFSVITVLEWFVGRVVVLFRLLNSFQIVAGVSLMSFSIACILLTVIIGAIVMRV